MDPKRSSIGCFALVLAMSIPGARARAQSGVDFFAGKNISLIIGSGEAGGYDIGGRLMARYLRKYIPGNPTITPRNMPGASSVVAAEYTFNVASRDGLTVATVQPGVVLNKSLDPAAKYQPERFTWIGRLQPAVLVGVGSIGAGYRGIEDARGKEIIVSASGVSGLAAIVPWALNRMAGTKFKVVRGYESVAPQFLAMERGEVMGIGSVSLADAVAHDSWLRDGRMALTYSISLRRTRHAPAAPAIVELARNDLDREVLGILARSSDIGQMLLAPPDVPAPRVAILRKAFDAMVADPDFIAEAGKAGIFVEPLDGEAQTALVKAGGEASSEALKKLLDVSKPPD